MSGTWLVHPRQEKPFPVRRWPMAHPWTPDTPPPFRPAKCQQTPALLPPEPLIPNSIEVGWLSRAKHVLLSFSVGGNGLVVVLKTMKNSRPFAWSWLTIEDECIAARLVSNWRLLLLQKPRNPWRLSKRLP